MIVDFFECQGCHSFTELVFAELSEIIPHVKRTVEPVRFKDTFLTAYRKNRGVYIVLLTVVYPSCSIIIFNLPTYTTYTRKNTSEQIGDIKHGNINLRAKQRYR